MWYKIINSIFFATLCNLYADNRLSCKIEYLFDSKQYSAVELDKIDNTKFKYKYSKLTNGVIKNFLYREMDKNKATHQVKFELYYSNKKNFECSYLINNSKGVNLGIIESVDPLELMNFQQLKQTEKSVKFYGDVEASLIYYINGKKRKLKYFLSKKDHEKKDEKSLLKIANTTLLLQETTKNLYDKQFLNHTKNNKSQIYLEVEYTDNNSSMKFELIYDDISKLPKSVKECFNIRLQLI